MKENSANGHTAAVWLYDRAALRTGMRDRRSGACLGGFLHLRREDNAQRVRGFLIEDDLLDRDFLEGDVGGVCALQDTCRKLAACLARGIPSQADTRHSPPGRELRIVDD